jgi:hypothetical protein
VVFLRDPQGSFIHVHRRQAQERVDCRLLLTV